MTALIMRVIMPMLNYLLFYPQSMEQKQKHLEFIQNTINRMANTSFLLKGWALTLVAGLFAINYTDNKATPVFILALLVTIIFWMLDGYFIKQERLFRTLYDEVRIKTELQIDFSMHTKHLVGGCNSLFQSVFSMTVAPFYFPLVIFILIFIINK